MLLSLFGSSLAFLTSLHSNAKDGRVSTYQQAAGAKRLSNQQTTTIPSYNYTALTNATLSSLDRRSLLFGLGLSSSLLMGGQEASAVLPFGKREKSSLLFVNAKQNASDSLQGEQVDLETYTLNSELCLLKLLPVKNPVFRSLERSITSLSELKSATRK